MKNLLLLTISLFVFNLSIWSQDCTGKYQDDIASAVDVETVKFGEAVNSQGQTQELFMDIYTPQGDQSTDRPVMIFAFGGSFIGGSRDAEDMVYFATEFAKKGYVCAAIDYRLATVFELFAEENLVKTVVRAIHDGKAAIRYFRQSAEGDNVYNIDPEKVFVGGTSAGGILALNLAYMNKEEKIPTEWEPWIEELGGLEGGSGNPGFCSVPNGVFSFAGAVVDTNWIDPTVVPAYSAHSTEDQTVPYGFGAPLSGAAPIEVYGSGLVHERLENLGTYNVLDTYYDNAHPPYSSSNADSNAFRVEEIENHLTEFLYNIMVCNPSNKLPDNVANCANSVGVEEEDEVLELTVYPNPSNGSISINKDALVRVYDLSGKQRLEFRSKKNQNVEINNLKAGTYILNIESDGLVSRQRLIKL